MCLLGRQLLAQLASRHRAAVISHSASKARYSGRGPHTCQKRAVEPLLTAVENLWTDGRMPLADMRLTDETCDPGAYFIV